METNAKLVYCLGYAIEVAILESFLRWNVLVLSISVIVVAALFSFGQRLGIAVSGTSIGLWQLVTLPFASLTLISYSHIPRLANCFSQDNQLCLNSS